MAESYAATISISHISTSAKAAKTYSAGGATKAAQANLRYILRPSAIEGESDVIAYRGGHLDKSRADLFALGDDALQERAERGGKNGVRLLDKAIISLPADATHDEHRAMMRGVLADLGGDSDAFLIAAVHRDRTGNPHAHLWAVDAKESEAAARARRPDAKRVRRADHLRFNEGGNREELRQRIAAQINAVATAAGRRRAEVRSLEAQGLTRAPQAHEGAQVAEKGRRKRGRRLTKRAAGRAKQNTTQALTAAHLGRGIRDPDAVPGRLWAWVKRSVLRSNAEKARAMDTMPVDDALDAHAAGAVIVLPDAQRSPERPGRLSRPPESKEEALSALRAAGQLSSAPAPRRPAAEVKKKKEAEKRKKRGRGVER